VDQSGSWAKHQHGSHAGGETLYSIMADDDFYSAAFWGEDDDGSTSETTSSSSGEDSVSSGDEAAARQSRVRSEAEHDKPCKRHKSEKRNNNKKKHKKKKKKKHKKQKNDTKKRQHKRRHKEAPVDSGKLARRLRAFEARVCDACAEPAALRARLDRLLRCRPTEGDMARSFHLAASAGDIDTVAALLQARCVAVSGASPASGLSALHAACLLQDGALASLLVAHGADGDLADASGDLTPRGLGLDSLLAAHADAERRAEASARAREREQRQAAELAAEVCACGLASGLASGCAGAEREEKQWGERDREGCDC